MSTLLNGLVFYFKLDESSDGSSAVTREDLGPSGIDLTDFNTTASATGKLKNACDFVRADETYLRASGFQYNMSNDWTLSAWINIDDKSADHDLIDVRVPDPVAGSVLLNYGVGVDRVVFFSTGNSALTSEDFGALTIGTWYHVIITRSAATSGLTMIINDTSEDSFNDIETIQNPSGKALTFGGIVQNGFSRHSDAKIDEVGFWDRVLTSAEITELYRSGLGNQYPFGGNTTITHEIRPAGGGDFTSLSAWESDQDRDLPGIHESARALCFGGNLGIVTLDGWFTASGNRIIIEGDDSAAHSGVASTDSSIAHINGGTSACIDNRESNVDIKKLSLQGTGAAANVFNFGATEGRINLDRIVSQGRSSPIQFSSCASGNTVRNSIIHDAARGLEATGAGVHVLVQNSTIHGGADGCFGTFNSAVIEENNNYLTAGANTIYQNNSGGSTLKGARTATSNTEADTVALRNIAFDDTNFQGTSRSPKDLLIRDDSALIAQGADLSGLGVTYDIQGDNRVGGDYDIGADQRFPVSLDEGNRLWLFF